ncbi:hypothetical protein EHW67_10795 [Arenibacter aquaticus]|uniref:Lipocalin-like domain-containing protein n=1 Tax=Arenibacter aquaticus TaxID=2489054 RepID=A0A3S0AMH9_9FLAO|nr:hypothetical protein [Arenibacter aquaticus]RTE53494.1 hypothetical protein EHW67_10795 [Arenibacter aquaticus]
MRPLYTLILCLALFGCKDKIVKSDLNFITGYWEIEKVTLPDGSKKEYPVNTSIDYMEVNNLMGFRKKVQPKFNGTYDTSNDAELFTIYERDGVFFMNYKTELSEWQEKIVSLSKNNLSLKSEDNITYHYKRFEPININ